MKRALLVDTNFSARPLKAALEQRGVEVHVMGARPSDALAKNTHHYIEADYSDPEAIVRCVETIGADHLIPGCNDLSYYASSEANRILSLPGIDNPSTLHTLHRKDAFREFCAGHGISAPRRYPVPETALDGGGPLVVKPADAYSGNGITLLHEPTADRLRTAFAHAESLSRNRAVVVEDFVEGQLYSHSAFLQDGAIARDFIVREYGHTNPYVVDTSYVVPSFTFTDRIRTEVSKVIEGLALQCGLVHTQFIATDSDVYLIEITRRCPGDLYSELIERSTGYPYPSAYTAAFCQQSIPESTADRQTQGWILRHTVTGDRRGFMEGLHFGRVAAPEAWYPLATTGEWLEPSPGGRVGVAFFRADSEPELEILANAAADNTLATIGYTGN